MHIKVNYVLCMYDTNYGGHWNNSINVIGLYYLYNVFSALVNTAYYQDYINIYS